MARRKFTALARPKPCLGLSPSCDCSMCVERRRRALEAAAMLEERARDGRRFDEVQGLVRASAPFLSLPPAEATVRLKRRSGEVGWDGFWEQLQRRESEEKAAVATLRKVARRCGFTLSARLVRRTATRQLRASVRCPLVLSSWGDNILSSTSLEEMRVWMEGAFRLALDVERQHLDEAAREFGFVVTEAKPRRGLSGSWTACSVVGAVPVHATTPDELRQLMREAANAPQAPHVETGLVEDDIPQADAEDVVAEPVERTHQRAQVHRLLGELLTVATRAAPTQLATVRGRRSRGTLVEVEVAANA